MTERQLRCNSAIRTVDGAGDQARSPAKSLVKSMQKGGSDDRCERQGAGFCPGPANIYLRAPSLAMHWIRFTAVRFVRRPSVASSVVQVVDLQPTSLLAQATAP